MTQNKMTPRAAAGFMWKDGKPYLRTTTQLNIIAKPQLMYWFGREVFYAMAKDPTIDEKTALSAPYVKSKVAKARGTTVHTIADIVEEKKVAPEFQLYSNAYWNAKKDLQAEEIEITSKSFYDEETRTSGTIDKYWLINGRNFLVDIKTGKDIYPEVRLQLSNYAHLMRNEGMKVDEVAVLLLEVGADDKPTGKYKWQVVEEDYESFLAARTLYIWQNKEKLIKLGYLEVEE